MASKDRFTQFKNRILTFILLSILFCAFALPAQAFAKENPDAIPSLSEFIQTVSDGNEKALRGIHVAGLIAHPIVQQPMGNPGYVSNSGSVITQFSIAADAGNVGLLAHNYLAGATFSKLKSGDTIVLVYGDGRTQSFVVESILQYQALSPFSPHSNFRDLDTQTILTAEQLFSKVYRGEYHLTLQTCIENEGNLSWGRLFIIAKPISKNTFENLNFDQG
jgi:hypothetical protein